MCGGVRLTGLCIAMEAALSVLAVRDGVVPPTLNLSDTGKPASDVYTHVVGSSRPVPDLVYAMSNSFGFGGTNVSLIFKKYRE